MIATSVNSMVQWEQKTCYIILIRAATVDCESLLETSRSVEPVDYLTLEGAHCV